MDYLFLHRDKRTFTSERQKNLLFRAARLYWEQKYADSEVVPKRKVDCELYKYVLYYLVFAFAQQPGKQAKTGKPRRSRSINKEMAAAPGRNPV